MAGDTQIRESLVIRTASAPAAPAMAAPAGQPSPPALHEYGDRVVITAHGAGAASMPLPPAATSQAMADDLSQIERYGRDAFLLRNSPEFIRAKANRSGERQPWNMGGCHHPIAPAGEAARSATLSDEAPGGAPGPTSAYLEGRVAVGIIIVNGPTADLQFSAAERTQVVAEVQNGLTWLAAQNPSAGITWVYDIRNVSIATPPNPGAPDLEALWRDPAMASLGYPASWASVGQYIEDNRTRLQTRWTYCVFFTKYQLGWFAYASIGGPRIVMQYSNDGWGPDNIDRVFTHETGHIFGAPDEYSSSGCNCAGSWGRFGQPNVNCQNCAPGGGVDCLMKGNSWMMCERTPAHLGWLKAFPPVRGTPALIQSRFGTKGNFEFVIPDAATGIRFSWRNNDDPNLIWAGTTRFGDPLGAIDSLTMIQSNFGRPGNLELIARTGSQLRFFWRDSGPSFNWNGPSPLFGGARGNPVLIQSRFGTKGNFELVYPASDGGIWFAWRNNDAGSLPWSAPVKFATSLGLVDEITMIQSNFGSPGNLELIARTGSRLWFFWRDSGPAFGWNGPFELRTAP